MIISEDRAQQLSSLNSTFSDVPLEQQKDLAERALNLAANQLPSEPTCKQEKALPASRQKAKQLNPKQVLLQRQLSKAMSRQQLANSGRSADGQGLFVEGDYNPCVAKEEAARIFIRINGVIQAYSPEAFSEITARPGNRVQYCPELLFHSSAPLLQSGGCEPKGAQVPKGHRPALYLEFIGEDVGWGAFALEDIKEGDLIGEYTGVVTKMGLGNAYTMFYSPDYPELVIDATHFGNEMRFVNHDDEPNCWFFYTCSEDGLPHRVFVATRNIAAGEQILTNYGEQYWAGLQPKKLR